VRSPPVAATGALALTSYCGHLIAISAMGPEVVFEPSNLRLACFIVVTLAVTWLWRTLLGRGPLERALHVASTSVADRVVPAGRRPTHPSAVEDVPHQGGPPSAPAPADESRVSS